MNEQEIRQFINEILNKFIGVCVLAGIQINRENIEVEILLAGDAHIPTRLRQGYMAVYIFQDENTYYKVGKVGINSNARYQFQHYKPYSSRSNLARSIINDNNLNGVIEIQNNVESWMKRNLTRINLLIPENILPEKKGKLLLNLLEAFLHCFLNPIYEG